MRHNEEYLGVDYGAVRVGIARGTSLAKIAEPLLTVPTKKAVDELIKLAKDRNVSGVVVGRPRNLSGGDTGQTREVQIWVDAAQNKIDLPFFWQDEALTSQLAEEHSHEAGADAVAAAIILQDFLDTPAEERVRC